MKLVRIENSVNLARDITSGAVINTNTNEYENYITRKKSNKELKEQIEQNSDKIQKIESDLSDIKQMLITLINKEK